MLLLRAVAALSIGGALIAGAAPAASPVVSTIPARPAWLSELSLGIKQGYDENVFLSGVDNKFLPAGYIVPAGSVAALENRASWVTTFSPKVTVNLAPLFGGQKTFQTLSLGYTPDYAFYHDEPSESYAAHRFTTAVKGKAGAFSLTADNCLTFIDGSRFGPTYPGGFLSAYATATARERREQIQDRFAVSLQCDGEKFFVRPTAALTYYDLMTKQINLTGYQNYADRYDVNGGADFGFKVRPQWSATLGYRYGHQAQEQFSFSPYSAPSDYQRILAGIEGKPWSWLDAKVQFGPDFRVYPGNTATHTTPVNDTRPVKYYGEASLTATITANDTVSFKYKQFQWVASTGKVPYFDSTYDLSYHRKLTDKLGLDLGGKLLTSDYTSGNLSTCRRDDRQYTVSAGLGYVLNPHASLSLAYAYDLGRNAQDGVVNPETRNFERHLICVGAVLRF